MRGMWGMMRIVEMGGMGMLLAQRERESTTECDRRHSDQDNKKEGKERGGLCKNWC